MIKLYIPRKEDLWFKKMLLGDEETMSYNHSWGGTIDFDESKWDNWYEHWIVNNDGKRYYRYLVNEYNEFVGEIAYHYDDIYCLIDVIIYSKYRNKGYGKEGLALLCQVAKENGINELYDNIAIDNTAIHMFSNFGFYEVDKTDDIIILKKEL